MVCFSPLHAYKSLILKTDNGKSVVEFDLRKVSSHPYEEIDLPCGQCIGCRIDRSRTWALRCVHEASLYTHNCFVTLTFDDDHLNEFGTLVKSDFQKFMKRLRKKFKGIDKPFKIRYFHCGEYGTDLMRPHHHACLFNFDFGDKVLWTVRDNVRLYRSHELEKLWPFGFCTIGDVTYESAAYVARYITKKVNGEQAKEHYMRCDSQTGEVYWLEPEYITMSRRPGIARDWYNKYRSDLYPKDFVTFEGKSFKVPKYYDRLYEVEDEFEFSKIKNQRILDMRDSSDNMTRDRLDIRRVCLENKLKRKERRFEK
jgi:hypothetical protein